MTREMRTPGWVKEARVPDRDVVLFLEKHTCLTTVHAAHVPLGFLRLNDRKRDDIKLSVIKTHSIAVGPWARPPVPLPGLSQASHSPFSVHIRSCCHTATKTSSSTVKMTL